MIFLGVSATLFVLIAATFSGRQARAEFSLAVQDVESRLQDIANDVSSGYYTNPGNFSCTAPSGIPTIVAAAQGQGTNDQCIFIGRAIQLDLANADGGNNGKGYNVYSIVGARQSGGENVENFTQANPRTITNPPQAIDLTESKNLPPGLVFNRMHVRDGGSFHQIRGVAFFSTFGGNSETPDSLSVNVVGLPGTNNSKSTLATSVSGVAGAGAQYTNPDGGVYLCLNGDASRQHAEFRLGLNGGKMTTSVTIREGLCGAPTP